MWVVITDLMSVCGIEIDLNSVYVSESTWFLWGVETYLVSVSGSKLTWFLCGGIEIGLI